MLISRQLRLVASTSRIFNSILRVLGSNEKVNALSERQT